MPDQDLPELTHGPEGPRPLGEAFGGPGLDLGWAPGAKQGVGTVCNRRSRVWFTLPQGIITEVYCPRVDVANTRDLQFLVTDGRTFFHEECRDLRHRVEYLDPEAPAYCPRSEDPAVTASSNGWSRTRMPTVF